MTKNCIREIKVQIEKGDKSPKGKKVQIEKGDKVQIEKGDKSPGRKGK